MLMSKVSAKVGTRSSATGRLRPRRIAAPSGIFCNLIRSGGNTFTASARNRLLPRKVYTLDSALLARPGNDETQLDLFLDYASNVALYPRFHAYFRDHRPPFLAVWGKNDPFFLPAGAEAFTRDIPDAAVRFFDTGHFALETHCADIATAIRDFLARNVRPVTRRS